MIFALFIVSIINVLPQRISFANFTKSILSLLCDLFCNNLGKTRTKLNKSLLIFWLLSATVLTLAYKSTIRDQIIKQPKTWITSPEQLANKPSSYTILATKNTPTEYKLKQRAKFDINFEKILNRTTFVAHDEILRDDIFLKTTHGLIGVFFNSRMFEAIANFEDIKKEFDFDEIKLDKVNDVRLIRKDYQFGDKIIYM